MNLNYLCKVFAIAHTIPLKKEKKSMFGEKNSLRVFYNSFRNKEQAHISKKSEISIQLDEPDQRILLRIGINAPCIVDYVVPLIESPYSFTNHIGETFEYYIGKARKGYTHHLFYPNDKEVWAVLECIFPHLSR